MDQMQAEIRGGQSKTEAHEERMKSTRTFLEQLDVRCQTLADRALEKDATAASGSELRVIEQKVDKSAKAQHQALETIGARLKALESGVATKHVRATVEPQLHAIAQKVEAVASQLQGMESIAATVESQLQDLGGGAVALGTPPQHDDIY